MSVLIWFSWSGLDVVIVSSAYNLICIVCWFSRGSEPKTMRRADNPQQQPRYDLYIVTENVGEDAEDGGHLNASYAASDPDTDPASSRRVSASGPEVEERLRVEITDEAVLGNGDLAPTSNTNTKTDKVRLDIDGLHSFKFKKS